MLQSHDKSGYHRRFVDAQEEGVARPNLLNAGGETQTASREAARPTRKFCGEILTSALKRDLAAANERQGRCRKTTGGTSPWTRPPRARFRMFAGLRKPPGRPRIWAPLIAEPQQRRPGRQPETASAGKAYSYGQELAGRAKSEASKAAQITNSR